MQGNGTSNNSTFTSTNAKDFNIEGLVVLNTTISASYVERQYLGGSIAYAGLGGTTFTTTFDPANNTTPSLAGLAGIYTGQERWRRAISRRDGYFESYIYRH